MPSRTIAVIDGGISGLAAAHVLSRSDRVTLFEADARLGGHADTHLVELPGAQIPVDTGFIVFNERTYPLLARLFGELEVSTQESEMRMSIAVPGAECALRRRARPGRAGRRPATCWRTVPATSVSVQLAASPHRGGIAQKPPRKRRHRARGVNRTDRAPCGLLAPGPAVAPVGAAFSG